MSEVDKFKLGMVVTTSNFLATFGEDATYIASKLVDRHRTGDWGKLDAHDSKLNDDAVTLCDGRIFSAYTVQDIKVYVITEHDRSSTCVLLASDY